VPQLVFSLLDCPLAYRLSTDLGKVARSFDSVGAGCEVRPTGFEPVTFGFVDRKSGDLFLREEVLDIARSRA